MNTLKRWMYRATLRGSKLRSIYQKTYNTHAELLNTHTCSHSRPIESHPYLYRPSVIGSWRKRLTLSFTLDPCFYFCVSRLHWLITEYGADNEMLLVNSSSVVSGNSQHYCFFAVTIMIRMGINKKCYFTSDSHPIGWPKVLVDLRSRQRDMYKTMSKRESCVNAIAHSIATDVLLNFKINPKFKSK